MQIIQNLRRDNMFRVLHLSDIHIGKTYKEPDSIACKIASDLDHNGLSSINCIVVTGDIFDGQVPVDNSLIDTAVRFFETLLSEVNCNQGKYQISKEDIIFVPGNHDLIRVDNLEERWSKYHTFLTKFYGEIPSFYFPKNYSLCKVYDQHKIVFIGFNSCEIKKKSVFGEKYISQFEKHVDQYELNKNGIEKSKIIEIMRSQTESAYDDYGYIPLSQITPIEREIKKLDDYTVVALFHHHFYLFPEIAHEFGDSSLIHNYTEVIQHLRYMNVSIVLHGHKHFALERPFITDDYYESSESIIDVFAGGSVGTNRKEEHTFGVLDLYPKKDDIKLKHNKFVYHGENLEPIIRKQVPPQNSSVKLIKLLDILKTSNPEKFTLYEESALKAFKSYDSCTKIISWVSEAITGFTDVYKYLDSDYNNILFLLYAINYRTISYMKIIGKETVYFESSSKTWDSFYDSILGETNFSISKIDYHKIFTSKKLRDASIFCDKLLNTCNDRKSQIYLAFTMLGIFFTDLYLVLTKYADDFKESIKYKVNIKIEENKFHENVPAPRIVVRSDADRRSVYIDLLCNNATAHKMAVLFIKEFDLLISKFEDYFKIIGLKFYYLFPKIDKDQMKNTLDNYNFEAYIPTLIPLLTGDNIYSSKVVFARELIQNSIDAISVREAKDTNQFSKKIQIQLNYDQNGKRYFKIIDNGTGMDRYKIERYFTSIGRSFYSGEEYEELNISYKPISNFGIGFLSSFMVCQEIDVKTKYYITNSEGLKLHIPNYDGCFFIELDRGIGIGTEVKLYLNSAIDDESIVDYIQKVMQDIRYPISIQYLNKNGAQNEVNIPAHYVRTQKISEKFKFFIPFQENGAIDSINYREDILSNNFIDKYQYGLFICKTKNFKTNGKRMILNSGISVDQASFRRVFGKRIGRSKYIKEETRTYNDIVVNFPANWLQLDVARENITELSSTFDSKHLGVKIAHCLFEQISDFIQYTQTEKTDIPASCLQEVIQYAIDFCGNQPTEQELLKKLASLRYILSIEFTEVGVCYKITRKGEQNKRIKLIYTGDSAEKTQISYLNQIYYEYSNKLDINSLLYLFTEVLNQNSVVARHQLRTVLHDLFGAKYDDITVLKFLTLFLLRVPEKTLLSLTDKNTDGETPNIISALETALLKHFYIGAEHDQKIEITYRELSTILAQDEEPTS